MPINDDGANEPVAWYVVCVKREVIPPSQAHTHILGLGTGDQPGWADMRWTLQQVLAAMNEGDRFYTKNEETDEIGWIEKYKCPICDKTHIRSAELDTLRECAYKADKPLPFSAS